MDPPGPEYQDRNVPVTLRLRVPAGKTRAPLEVDAFDWWRVPKGLGRSARDPTAQIAQIV